MCVCVCVCVCVRVRACVHVCGGGGEFVGGGTFLSHQFHSLVTTTFL